MDSFAGFQDAAAHITRGHMRLCLNCGTRRGVLSFHAHARSPASPSHVQGKTQANLIATVSSGLGVQVRWVTSSWRPTLGGLLIRTMRNQNHKGHVVHTDTPQFLGCRGATERLRQWPIAQLVKMEVCEKSWQTSMALLQGQLPYTVCYPEL